MWIGWVATAAAQNLLAPWSFPTTDTDVYVVLRDGTRLEGHVGVFVETNGVARRFKIRDASGVKHRVEHEDIVEAGIRLEGRAPVEASSLQDAMRGARGEGAPLEWLTFVRVPLSDDHAPLMMVLNPGFDARMRVFWDPSATEAMGLGIGGVAITGGGPTSRLIWRAGAPRPERVEKRRYEDRWDELFGDCPGAPKPDPVRWVDFERHVWAADRACGAEEDPVPEAPAPEPPAEPPPEGGP